MPVDLNPEDEGYNPLNPAPMVIIPIPPAPPVRQEEIAPPRAYHSPYIQMLLAEANPERPDLPAIVIPRDDAPEQAVFCTPTRMKMGFYGFMTVFTVGWTLQLPQNPLLGLSLLSSILAMLMCGECDFDLAPAAPAHRPPSP